MLQASKMVLHLAPLTGKLSSFHTCCSINISGDWTVNVPCSLHPCCKWFEVVTRVESRYILYILVYAYWGRVSNGWGGEFLNFDINTVMNTKYLPTSKCFHFGTLVLKSLLQSHHSWFIFTVSSSKLKNPSINTEGCFQLSEFSSFEGCLRAHGWVKTTRVLGTENLF